MSDSQCRNCEKESWKGKGRRGKEGKGGGKGGKGERGERKKENGWRRRKEEEGGGKRKREKEGRRRKEEGKRGKGKGEKGKGEKGKPCDSIKPHPRICIHGNTSLNQSMDDKRVVNVEKKTHPFFIWERRKVDVDQFFGCLFVFFEFFVFLDVGIGNLEMMRINQSKKSEIIIIIIIIIKQKNIPKNKEKKEKKKENKTKKITK